MSDLYLYKVSWTSVTAGASPDGNNRTELFLWGCSRGANGRPCKGCFNPLLWKVSDDAIGMNPLEVAEQINKMAPNKFVTIVGGEPLDQLDGLTELCDELKKRGFHIILFTSFKLKDLIKKKRIIKLIKRIDLLVDGMYDSSQRIYDESLADGLHDAIGSANQIIWDLNGWNNGGPLKGARAGALDSYRIKEDFQTEFSFKVEKAPVYLDISEKEQV